MFARAIIIFIMLPRRLRAIRRDTMSERCDARCATIRSHVYGVLRRATRAAREMRERASELLLGAREARMRYDAECAPCHAVMLNNNKRHAAARFMSFTPDAAE